MEEHTSVTEATQEITGEQEIQGAAEQPEGGKDKLFTQDEVNGLMQSRISRLKGQAAKDARAEYDQKLMELQARETKLMVKEALSDRNMPRELADIITCTDEADLKNKLDALNKIYGNKAKEDKPTGFTIVGARPAEGNGRFPSGPDPVRHAMGLE